MILGGFFRERFGQELPAAMTASIAFEQSYSGIDGDSASSTEIYALLSALSGVPIAPGPGRHRFGRSVRNRAGHRRRQREDRRLLSRMQGDRLERPQGVLLPRANIAQSDAGLEDSRGGRERPLPRLSCGHDRRGNRDFNRRPRRHAGGARHHQLSRERRACAIWRTSCASAARPSDPRTASCRPVRRQPPSRPPPPNAACPAVAEPPKRYPRSCPEPNCGLPEDADRPAPGRRRSPALSPTSTCSRWPRRTSPSATTSRLLQHVHRRMPPRRGFLVAAGLERVLEALEQFHFAPLSHRISRFAAGSSPPSFCLPWRDYVLPARCRAMPEGTIFFANRADSRVRAPLIEAQLHRDPRAQPGWAGFDDREQGGAQRGRGPRPAAG